MRALCPTRTSTQPQSPPLVVRGPTRRHVTGVSRELVVGGILVLLAALFALSGGTGSTAGQFASHPSATVALSHSIHPANGTGIRPNVTLHGNNGNLTLAAALYYNTTAHSFQVNAVVNFSGGTAPYNLSIYFAPGTGANVTMNTSAGVSRVTYYYNESMVNYFQARLIQLSNLAMVVVSTNITAIVPASPLFLFVQSYNDTTHGAPDTALSATLAGGRPPYSLSIQFGDGSSWNGTNLSFLGSPHWYSVVVALHTYGSVSGPRVYDAVAAMRDSLGATTNATLRVAPNYNFPTGGGGSGSVTYVDLNSTNGSLRVSVVLQLNSSPGPQCGCLLEALANVSLTGGTPPFVSSMIWGDGGLTNATNSSQYQASHGYTAPANYTYRLSAHDANGTIVSVSTVIVVPANHSHGSSGSNRTSQTVHLGATNNGLTINLTLWLNGTASPTNSTGSGVSWLNLSGLAHITGGVSPYSLNVTYGDGTIALYRTLGNVSLNHSYSYRGPATFNLTAAVSDFNSTSVVVQLAIPVPPSSGGGPPPPPPPPPPPYPASVTVTVVATPVTGLAPLNVSFSALINGGRAPFAVQWSLPTGNGTINATGLSVSEVYTIPGWYPATAFVYNTSSAYGTVLVGYGSVWVYVGTASGGGSSGGGSGNNSSGHHHHSDPVVGGFTAFSGVVRSPMFVAFLIAIGVGGGVGVVVGYSFGAGRRPPPWNSARREDSANSSG